jgi:SAM-dependent methyltransferase
MIDQEILNAASRNVLARNIRVLQGYRLAPTEREHIEKLLVYMAPATDSHWVDIGCGFGEPARLLQELRPDLEFTLVNNNSFQLSQAPAWMPSFCCDMQELPIKDEMFDGAMFLYSLCQADDPIDALIEAARVVSPGGRLFVFDYLRVKGSDELSEKYLAAKFMPDTAMPLQLRAAGWTLEGVTRLTGGDDRVFRELFDDQSLYDRIFIDLRPAIWWAIK